ncbi:MAG: hypothetical protein AMJ46_13495 [Latescibacteria bacterium DG_63]|nr:MAG: hypothetical protein AMJ46_13495 [Latescibacteria bacterium DG_63]
MAKHVTFVAALQIGLGVLGVLVGIIVWVVVVGAGLISGDEEAIAITTLIGSIIALFVILLSIPSILGGIGLLKRWSWARILVLVVSVVDLVHIPIGTAVGIYSIWVLLQEETKQLFGPVTTA